MLPLSQTFSNKLCCSSLPVPRLSRVLVNVCHCLKPQKNNRGSKDQLLRSVSDNVTKKKEDESYYLAGFSEVQGFFLLVFFNVKSLGLLLVLVSSPPHLPKKYLLCEWTSMRPRPYVGSRPQLIFPNFLTASFFQYDHFLDGKLQTDQIDIHFSKTIVLIAAWNLLQLISSSWLVVSWVGPLPNLLHCLKLYKENTSDLIPLACNSVYSSTI